MAKKTDLTSIWGKAGNVLGEDFWEVISEVFPNIGPRIDMCQIKEEVVIVAEIPGIGSPSDIAINLSGYTISIEGKIERPYAKSEDQMLLDERFHGPFKRKLSIPRNTMPDQLKANYQHGLLLIRIPIIPEAVNRDQKIDIEFENENKQNHQ